MEGAGAGGLRTWGLQREGRHPTRRQAGLGEQEQQEGRRMIESTEEVL